MQLLISDANILIDVEVGGLAGRMFRLPYAFAVPDILFYEELESRHGRLRELGLAVMEMAPELMMEVARLSARYAAASRHDLTALILAKTQECPLLSGDRALRAAAEREQVTVRGTLWLVQELVAHRLLTVAEARTAYAAMKAAGSRLPWHEAEAGLKEFESDPAPMNARSGVDKT